MQEIKIFFKLSENQNKMFAFEFQKNSSLEFTVLTGAEEAVIGVGSFETAVISVPLDVEWEKCILAPCSPPHLLSSLVS